MNGQRSGPDKPAEPPKGNGRRGEAPAKLLSRPKIIGGLAALFSAIIAGIVSGVFLGWFSRPPSPTQTIFYQPTTETGQVSGDLAVAHRVTGYCYSGSGAAPRQGAYRCVSGNGLYDPCFTGNSGDTQVVCPYPSPESVTVMRLTRPLPIFSTSSSVPYPWLLALAGGEQCEQLTGATTSFGGMPLNYYCGKGNGSLYGTINKTNPVWTIFELRNGSSDMTQVAIAKAYF